MILSLVKKLAVFGLSVVALALFAGQVLAQQAIVITYKQDLFEENRIGKNLAIPSRAGVEAACVATVLARNLQLASGMSGQEVAMFPALAGVKLANERLLLESGVGAEPCLDPDEDAVGYFSDDFGIDVPDDFTLLIDVVRVFLSPPQPPVPAPPIADGRMVVCPLCWNSRGYDAATFPIGDLFEGAEIGTSSTVGPLFLEAQKVVDF